MLRFPKGRAPNVLDGWPADADWESLPAAGRDEVREALLRDQGQLCAYCERRIPAKGEPMKVEHWEAQSTGKGSMRWQNLLGVCRGGEGLPRSEQHCDTFRGNAALFIHPVEGLGPSPREHLAYTAEGEVRVTQGSARAVAVECDIQALHMNVAKLRRARREVYDELKRRLDRVDWSAKALRDEHKAARVEPGRRASEHCEVVRYHVARWARQKGSSLESR